MDVLHHHALRFLQLQLDIGKVPDAPHPARHQPVGQRARHMAGHRQHRHAHRMLGEVALQRVGVVDPHPRQFRAHDGAVHVEGGGQGEPALLKVEVLDERPAQVARAKDDGSMPPVHAQNVGDLAPELLNVVAVPLLAELAEAGQVLADLGGCQVHGVPQCVGGNTHDPRLEEVVQMAVIAGQAADYGVGYLLLFHRSAHPS